MSISTTANRIAYTGNGVTVAFSFPYQLFAAGDLVVLETVIATGVQTTKTNVTDYSISGVQDASGVYQSGCTVTAVTAPASTVTWTLYRDPAATQTQAAVDNDPLPASLINNGLDYLTQLSQRNKDLISRGLVQPDGDSAAIARLPAKVSRASKFLAFDSNGDPVAAAGTSANLTPVSAFIDTLLDDADAATARTTLGVPLGTSGAKVPLLNTAVTFSGLLTASLGLTVTGAGVQAGAPTGGDKGVGTINSADHSYVNGVRTDNIAQVVNTETGAAATGTTTTPLDDTIPQITEGDQYMSLAITPKNASSTLIIDVRANAAASLADDVVMALHQDTTANALAATAQNFAAGGAFFPMTILHKMTAGTTSATTFRVRIGKATSGTITFNGVGGARKFGGVLASSITITEILP